MSESTDSFEERRWIAVTASTIEVPGHQIIWLGGGVITEMRRLAVSTLFEVMNGEHLASIRIPTELVVRASIGTTP